MMHAMLDRYNNKHIALTEKNTNSESLAADGNVTLR